MISLRELNQLASRGIVLKTSELGSVWPSAIFVAGLALVLRLVVASHESQLLWDETFHLLAARSWLEDATFAIADGEYRRSTLFTVLVAEAYRLFGESVFVARLPSVLAGTLWVVAIFLWTSAVAGSAAGWIAALFFCFSPVSLFLSQFIRFYALHGVCFFVLTCGWYLLITSNLSVRKTIGVLTVVIFSALIALHLQVTTLIGLFAIGIWTAVELARQWLSIDKPSLRLKLMVLLYAGTLLCAILLLITDGGRLLDLYSSGAVFAAQEESGRNIAAYHQILVGSYPTLWTLFPLGFLLALRRSAREFVFAVSFVLHSFAGRTAERYIAYAIPYFFVIWAIALVEIWPRVTRLVIECVER